MLMMTRAIVPSERFRHGAMREVFVGQDAFDEDFVYR